MRRSCSDSPLTASQMDGVFGSDSQHRVPPSNISRLRTLHGPIRSLIMSNLALVQPWILASSPQVGLPKEIG
jgi:hypothetical protein